MYVEQLIKFARLCRLLWEVHVFVNNAILVRGNNNNSNGNNNDGNDTNSNISNSDD